LGHDEPLSALDSTFFAIEGDATHMHVGAVATFETGPLATRDGGVDFPRIRRYAEWALQSRPRYRQRLLRIPGIDRYLWRDDDRFNINFHLRHTALPRPGDERQLKRLAGRIFSHPIDRSRPPWELWIVEGLDDDRFAAIFKIHHAMIDGVAGMDLMTALFRGTPDATVPEMQNWRPRPAPTARQLVREEWQRRAAAPGALWRAAREAVKNPDETRERARTIARGVGRTLRNGLIPASSTSINPRSLGPYRRFDWTEMPLDGVKAIKRQLGGTVNDAALAMATGALGDFLEGRGDRVNAIRDFRAMLPVNVRGRGQAQSLGNFVASIVARLPLAERDPLRRLEAVRRVTGELKNDGSEVVAAQFLEKLSDTTGTALVADVLKLATFLRAFNVVITNVPGPPFPLYLLGAELVSIYPLVPLFDHQGVGIALVSYNGRFFWGLNGDWQTTPDLHELVDGINDQYRQYSALAGAEPEPARPRAPVARPSSATSVRVPGTAPVAGDMN